MPVKNIWDSIKISHKIIFGMLICGLPTLLIVFITHNQASTSSLNNSMDLIQLLAKNHSREINQTVNEYSIVFDNWTKDEPYGVVIEYNLIEDINEDIHKKREVSEGFNFLVLTDAKGTILIHTKPSEQSSLERSELKGQLLTKIDEELKSKVTVRFVDSPLLKHGEKGVPKTFQFSFPSKNSWGETNGIFFAYLDWQIIQNQLDELKTFLFAKGYIGASVNLMEVSSGLSLIHSNQELAGKTTAHVDEIRQFLSVDDILTTNEVTINQKSTYFSYGPILDSKALNESNLKNLTSSDLVLGLYVPEKDILSKVNKILYFSLGLTVILFVFLVAIAFFVNMGLKALLGKTASMMNHLSNGRFCERTHYQSTNEIGIICSEMDNLANELELAIESVNRIMKAMAEGDLSQRIDLELKGDLNTLMSNIGKSSSLLNQMISKVVSVSEKIRNSAMELSASSQSLASGSYKQAASIEEISASLDEINKQTQKNTEGATYVQELTEKTLSIVNKGNEQMMEMTGSMDQISETSTNVSSIIKVIDEIAFQTNLLALNAAIEAARAGKYGKGFSVVAEEVRSLSARSSKAVKDTTSLIERSIAEVKSGVSNAHRTAKILEEITESTSEINKYIRDITDASKEQSGSISEISTGLSQVNQIVQENSSVSQETASSSTVMSNLASELQATMDQFTLQSGDNGVESSHRHLLTF